MTSFTPAGSSGVPISTSSDGATTPVVATLELPLADTEASYELPAGVRQFLVKLRGMAVLRLATVSSDPVNYITIPRGCSFSQGELKLTSSIELYFQSPEAGQVVEIITWS